ncbi:hypothetical protein [Robertmurraya massiliosenegalensis]|uniref:hypothetical protein n=1 Tax=Robertmurraya massiliosenegalensis TaxID=1287657 RepID=UPI0003135146|nr:hypothetical protein [Robertmurraya massiliosenegalensis]
MNNKEMNDFATGWVAGEIIEKATKDDKNNGAGCGAVLFYGFVGFILFSIYAISGVEFSKIWGFLKVVTFPITWDYQYMDFKLFGPNNYASTFGSLAWLLGFVVLLKILDKVILHELEGNILKKRIGQFQPVKTTIVLLSFLYDKVLGYIIAFFMGVLVFKIMWHGFLSIFTFIFSI